VSGAHALAILAAGVAAGTINTVVGSGTLITFPVLLALGYPPVVANVSNTVGLVPGSATGAIGYRRELHGQRNRTRVLSCASMIGGAIGAALLLILPASAFKAIVPAFIALALIAIIAQPRLMTALASRRRPAHQTPGPFTLLAVGLCGVYGGYFGAAQGIMLIAILSIAIDEELQRINALKVVLAGLVNFVAGVIFVLVANVAWAAAGLIAIGAMFGGMIGARWGRRLPPNVLRGVVVVVGVIAIARLL
jgi:uncharacterized membrane protein YfcA